MLSFILDFVYPPSCPVCKKVQSENGVLCADCWYSVNWISDPKCFCCGYPFPANIDHEKHMLCPVCISGKNIVDWMRAACVYDDASRDIMLPFKHAGALRFQKLMSKAMINLVRDVNDIDVVIPVPLSFWRLAKRGYNQATLLARPIAKHLNATLDIDSVRRIHRRDMGHLNAAARRKNIRGVFHVQRPDLIKGKVILLVDDVFTTGATFYELRRTLKKAGAKEVRAVVFCRTVKAI
ncbi:MAG: ComF family protein [Alphaproteobacteria bacterium]|nr:ComF family protein [Alphaproteobacteria bacterium]